MKISIIGTGPSGLMAGYQLLKRGIAVQFYDQKKVAGRKFLVAGHGGFNLTHSKSLEEFIRNYNHKQIQQAVLEFNNEDTIAWLQEIGIPTFVGSSGKVFPQKGIKPIEVLDAWLSKIEELGGTFKFEHQLLEWKNDRAKFSTKGQEVIIPYDKIIFSLGGASWKKTGSNGAWLNSFREMSVKVNDFQPSNAGMNCKDITSELEGLILKNCNVTLGETTRVGEVLFTNYGLEGAPIYALNANFREGNKQLVIDLKPTYSNERLLEVLRDTRFNRTEQLRMLKIPKTMINFLKLKLSKEEYLSDAEVFKSIKSLKFEIDSLRPLDEAISTVGGISMDELNGSFELINYPNHYVIGEMLDWDAPTGGYLLQACFSMGVKVAKQILVNG